MTGSGPRIMVVDDDPGMRLTLAGIIEEEGFEILEAADGYQAVNLAREHSVDLIFMDIIMPGMNGVEAFQEIKWISPGTTVVMMTGFSDSKLVVEALQHGAHSIGHKPFKVSWVIETLREVLNTVVVLVATHRDNERVAWSALLENAGYQVFQAMDGPQAVKMAAEKHYDVIILDEGITDTSCYGLLGQIRVFDPLVKVVLIVSDSAEVPDAGLDLGSYSLLARPVDGGEILALTEGSTRHGRDL